MKSPGPTESELHISVANLLDWVLLPPAMYSTFPSGWGVLSPSMAQRLRKSGLKAGMPDVLIFYDGRCFGLELKARGNTVTPAQRETHDKLFAAGTRVHICRSLGELMGILDFEGVPVRKVRGGDPWLQNRNVARLGETSAERGDTDAGEGDESRKSTSMGSG